MLFLNKKQPDEVDPEILDIPQGSWAEIWYALKRNKRAMLGLIFIVFLILLAIFADFIAPYGMKEQNLSNALQFPNATHWLGTDDLGRDVLSRLIYGTRISLTVGVSAVLVALIAGGILGILSH